MYYVYIYIYNGQQDTKKGPRVHEVQPAPTISAICKRYLQALLLSPLELL